MPKIVFDSAFEDAYTNNAASVRSVKFTNTHMVYHPSTDVYAHRTKVRITYPSSMNVAQILPANQMIANFYTDIEIPSLSSAEDINPKIYTYRVRPDFNYSSLGYDAYSLGLKEHALLSVYLQENSDDNKNIPGIGFLKNLDFPINEDKFKNFSEQVQPYYKKPTDPRTKKWIFDYNHQFSENANAVKYPSYNEVLFSYKEPRIMFPLFKEASDVSSTNLFERIMLMIGMYPNNFFTVSQMGGYNSYDFLQIKNNYFNPISDSDVLYLSEDYHNHQIDWTHLFKIDNIITTVSSDSSFRDYEQLINGAKAKNEFLFFKIEKRSTNTVGAAPDQTFIVPAKSDFVSFIDTQIKNNIDYTYVVTGYCAIFGSISQFHNVQAFPAASSGAVTLEAECDVDVSPAIKIIEVPYFTYTAKATKIAPMRPIVSFHNESNSSNKVKIYLENDKGAINDSFTPIEPLEIEQFENVDPVEDDLYRFGYTKEQMSFEMYRTDNRPESYEDFSNHLVGTFSTNDISPSLMIHDHVKSGQKYYYTFRARSQDELFSNPSAVYEVELLKTAGDSVLNVSTILFDNLQESLKKNEISRDFRSLFQIIPNDTQAEFMDLTNMDDDPVRFGLDNISLGPDADESIWGRKFKIRIRSNDSGKAIDFNVKFNLIKKNSEDNFPV